MIQAVFFDIDGTLLNFKDHTAPASTIRALHRLQEKGVRIFIATGRAPFQIDLVRRQLPVAFDGFVMVNGQYCLYQNQVVHSQPIPPEDIQGILPYLEQSGVSCAFVELDYVYFNRVPEVQLHRVKESKHTTPRPADDPARRIFTHTTYQLSLYTPPEQEVEAMACIPNCRAVRWTPVFADIIPKTGGKAVGIGAMLNHLGLDFSQCAAFGDGGNDIEMLQAAGIGVAMGGSAKEVIQAADFTTRPLEEDGVEYALEKLGIL